MPGDNVCPPPSPSWSPPTPPWDTNVFTRIKNWITQVGSDRVEWTQGNKYTYTGGVTLENTLGSKSFYIKGALVEFFLALKFEQVIGAETKVNIGVLLEVFLGYRSKSVIAVSLEIDVAAKVHLFPGDGLGWKATAKTVTAAEDKHMVKLLKKEIGTLTAAVGKQKEVLSSLSQTITTATETIGTLNASIDEMARKSGSVNISARQATIDYSGTVTFDVGSFSGTCTGAVVVEGPKVSLDGGGGKVDIGATIDLNGKVFVT